MGDFDPIKEKIIIIGKDLDMSAQFFNRSATHLSTLHGWSVALTLAYFAFLGAAKAHNPLILAPLMVMLALFVVREARLRRDLACALFDIQKIKHMFMESDPEEFTKKIKQYKFKAPRESKGPNIRKYLEIRMIAWYVVLFLLGGAAYLAIIKFSGQTVYITNPCR